MAKNYLSKLSFVDVETTGTSAMSDRVIDIGIVRVENGKIVEEFESLVNPQTYLSPYIAQMTSITQEMLYRAPLFEEIKSKVYDLLDGTTFVAHNAQFDYAFIKQEFARLETKFTAKMLCTVRLSRSLFPDFHHHNLDAIIERFNIDVGQRHRAFPDAKALFYFMEKARAVTSEESFSDAIERLIKRSRLPSSIDPAMVKKIPNLPGVYVFYDSDGTVLYVGKSTHLKDRVLNHFSSFHSNTTDLKLAASTTDIEITRCGGDLSASLLEADLIKKLQPVFNKQLRLMREAVAVVKSDKNDYHTIEIKRVKIPLEEGYENILTIFPSIKKAKESIYEICKERHICMQKLGLEKGKGGCFYYQIGKCDGACVGKESALKHNVKVIEAFGSYFIPQWPFDGKVAITEKSGDLEEITYVDKWIHVGSKRVSEGLEKEDTAVSQKGIYIDSVKIFKKFLFKKYNLRRLKIQKV